MWTLIILVHYRSAMFDKVTWKHFSGRRDRRFFRGIVVLRISNKYSLSITSHFGIYNGRSLKYIFAFRQWPFTQYCKIEFCAHERCAFLRAVCFAWRFYWVILTSWLEKIYFLPFGSGLLLNIAKLRFVHMKGVHFYVLSALLGVLLSNSNVVVRKNILFAFRQRPSI